MTHELPESAPYIVLGGGVHGLSSAYHLARALEETGRGSGQDVIVLEKNRLGAGASGIACGVVRNFYFSPPMAEVIRVSVELFESDPAGFGFHGVGYIAAVPEVQAEDCVAIQRHQAEIGYRSEVIRGERACQEHMEAIFPDWNGAGIEAVLHEHQGGWAETDKTVENLGRLARAEGVRIFEGVEITGFDIRDGRVLADGAGGIESKTGRRGFGVGGGGVPIRLGSETELEPYGHSNPDHVVGDEFTDYFTAGLAWAHKRFRGKGAEWHTDPHGGIGAFTPDNYPVVDYVLPNAYMVMDSNHGFKMIGLGKLVANDIVGGGESRLDPFRLSRYEHGVTHAVSHSPYPWN
jgi:glycine/D-amino acid oxidase-like deaminating enzyme